MSMLKIKRGGVDLFIVHKSFARSKRFGCYFSAPFCAVNFYYKTIRKCMTKNFLFFLTPSTHWIFYCTLPLCLLTKT